MKRSGFSVMISNDGSSIKHRDGSAMVNLDVDAKGRDILRGEISR